MHHLLAPNTVGHDAALLLARLGLAALFVQRGFGKLLGYPGLVGRVGELGLLLPPLAATLAIPLKPGGSLATVPGLATRWAALGLVVFTLRASVLVHISWNLPGPERAQQALRFMNNLDLAGGFLALLAAGRGRYALAARLGRAGAGSPARS